MCWDWGGWERGKERWMEKESWDVKLQRVLQVRFSDSVLVRGGKGVQAGFQNSSDEAKTRCWLVCPRSTARAVLFLPGFACRDRVERFSLPASLSLSLPASHSLALCPFSPFSFCPLCLSVLFYLEVDYHQMDGAGKRRIRNTLADFCLPPAPSSQVFFPLLFLLFWSSAMTRLRSSGDQLGVCSSLHLHCINGRLDTWKYDGSSSFGWLWPGLFFQISAREWRRRDAERTRWLKKSAVACTTICSE